MPKSVRGTGKESRAKYIEQTSRRAAGNNKHQRANRKPSEERWVELLQVSAELFASQGYNATSLQDIADRLNLLKGSIYHYIHSKDDLLYEICRRTLNEGLERLESAANRDGDAVTRIRAAITTHLDHLIRNHTQTTVFLHEGQRLPTERRRQIPSARYEAIFRDLIVEGQREGCIRSDIDPKLAARVVLGAANWIYRWYQVSEDQNPERLASSMADLIIEGLAN